ncbi:hypothetical protein ZWY2020_028392 [Hordeum vulgare]|nr:hypothetical protein ZWY2020_028392 [Hordeum vulgare]
MTKWVPPLGLRFSLPPLLLLVAVIAPVHAYGKLEVGFYRHLCPDAEAIVRRIVTMAMEDDLTVTAPLLRLHFHDCFVRGCDGSVLVNSTKTNIAERDAKPNHTLDAFNVIDTIKERLEEKCPGTVSCADILAVAARDAVSLATKVVTKGEWNKDGNLYEVETGRRDGRVSSAKEAAAELPDSFDGIQKLIKRFASKGLGLKDLVVLSGAHALGNSHCPSLEKRLRNFTADDDMDPTLDKTYAATLKQQCTNSDDNVTEVQMVPGRSTSFDATYYRLVTENKGLFHSDEALLSNGATKMLVYGYMSLEKRFLKDFGVSMVNMGRVDVLAGSEGEIRRTCAVLN